MIINKELFKKHFGFQSLIDMQENCMKQKTQAKIKKFVQLTKSGLVDIDNEMEEISED